MNKVTALQLPEDNHLPATNFSQKQIDILKNSICKDLSYDEFEVFLMACTKTHLDPFMKQIYAIKRGGIMTIQTGIDGFRLVADRTGKYVPGQEPTYAYDTNGNLLSATAYIKKLTSDGTWHTVSATAHFDEYCQRYNGKPSPTWAKMPRVMLAKCAESLAIKRAFPAETSGVYTQEEMSQSDTQEIVARITKEQSADLKLVIEDCEEKYREILMASLMKQFKIDSLDNLHLLPQDIYPRVRDAATKNMMQTRQAQTEQKQPEFITVEEIQQ